MNKKSKSDYNREYYEKNKESEKKRKLEWYYENKDKIDKEKQAERLKDWSKKNREHVKAYRDATKDKGNARRRELYAQEEDRRISARQKALEWSRANPEKRKAQRLRDYKISAEDFESMLEKQGGKCAICGYSSQEKLNFFPLIDHCHKTGKVRGILCLNCNHGLGQFKDSKERLARAILYLESSESEIVKP